MIRENIIETLEIAARKKKNEKWRDFEGYDLA